MHRAEGMELAKLRHILGATCASLLLAFTASVQAKTTHVQWNKSTSKGRPFIAGEHWDVNRDCSLRSFPTAKVISPPKHGTAKVGQGKVKIPRKHAKDPYYKCKSFNVSGTTVRYSPDPAFTGKDKLKVRVLFSTGDIHEIDITITVR
jgi:hypothetical protein